MLKLEKITKKFGEKVAVDEVSMEIDKNSIVGLLGPNGAGKTTLMRVIVGFLTANEGRIYWNKKLVEPKSEDYKENVGYLPENNPLYLNMTPLEYLELIASLRGVEKGRIKQQIEKVAEECGIERVLGQLNETLSKGFRQRVGLAATLIGEPKILILDEPTSGLDPNQIIEIRELIKGLAKNKMILLSTHILPEAKAICEKLLIIHQGKIVLDQETKKIKSLEKKFVELTA
jgi:ABC-2 type transport system ATP-binding protein